MSRHTPGPWRVWADEGKYTSVCAITGAGVDAEHRICVASVRAVPEESEEISNAHLIAASPDLYKSLRETRDAAAAMMRWAFAAGVSEQMMMFMAATFDGFGKRAEEALRKAEGDPNLIQHQGVEALPGVDQNDAKY